MKSYTLWNENWKFIKEDVGPAKAADAPGEAVTLLHTWNAIDGQDDGNDYYRGTCWYVKEFPRPELEAGDEAWLELRGAAMTAEVFLNGRRLARHEGGYSTFRVELTRPWRSGMCWPSAWTTGKTAQSTPRRRTSPSTAASTGMCTC